MNQEQYDDAKRWAKKPAHPTKLVGRISDSVIRRMMFIHIPRNTAIAYCALLAPVERHVSAIQH